MTGKSRLILTGVDEVPWLQDLKSGNLVEAELKYVNV